MTIVVDDSEPRTKPAPSAQADEAAAAPPSGQERPAPQKRWKTRLAPAIVLSIGAVIVAAVSLWPAPAGSLNEPDALPAVSVKVEPIVPVARQRDEIRLPAVVEPYRVVKVAAEVPGRIERIGPVEGSDVEPDQPLLWLNTDLLRAARDQAAAKYELDLRELRRYEELDGRGVATDIELYRARAASAISKALLDQVDERLKRAVIRSPTAGVLNDMLVEPGEYVGAGTPVAEVVQIDRVKVVVNLPERDVVHVRLGQEVRVLVDAIDDYELTGKVTYISACGDEKCRTFRTEVTADNRDRRARAGLVVRVVLLRRILPDAVMIPLASVIPTEDGYQVYVEKDGKARRRDVRIGLIVGDRVQATTGLKAGDRLIVDGHRLVGDGSPVRVVE